jgi:hypothetical protein
MQTQIDAAKRAAEQQQRQQQFLQTLPSPGMQASQAALAGGGGPTMTNAQRLAPVDPMQSAMWGAVQQGLMPLPSYMEATRKDNALTVVPEGGTAIRADGRVVAQGGPKASDIPSSYREWQLAASQGYKGSFEQWTLAQKQAGAQTISLGTPLTVNDPRTGQPVIVMPPNRPGAQPQILQLPGGVNAAPSKEPKSLTESEGNAAAFYMRAQNAIDNLNKVPKISNGDYWKGNVPFGAGNFLMSPQGQQAQNAEKQFIAAVLRKESGASISNGEYQSYGEQFFPRPGDSADKLTQKAQNRQVALEGMKVQAGPEGTKKAGAGLGMAQRMGPGSMPMQGGPQPAGGIKFLGFE